MDPLLELERAGWQSLCDGTGSAFYGDVMIPEGLMVLANGQVMTRDDLVTALGGAPPWSEYSIDDVRHLELADGAAALVYAGTGRRGDESAFVGAMTSVYVRREGAWKLALYQQTATPSR